jgi:hypothetical protein
MIKGPAKTKMANDAAAKPKAIAVQARASRQLAEKAAPR